MISISYRVVAPKGEGGGGKWRDDDNPPVRSPAAPPPPYFNADVIKSRVMGLNKLHGHALHFYNPNTIYVENNSL